MSLTESNDVIKKRESSWETPSLKVQFTKFNIE